MLLELGRDKAEAERGVEAEPEAMSLFTMLIARVALRSAAVEGESSDGGR